MVVDIVDGACDVSYYDVEHLVVAVAVAIVNVDYSLLGLNII